MSGGIFILHDDGRLDEMNEKPYDSESLLQELIARYPNLLAGDQIDSVQPKRWLLVSREMAVPGDDEGASRWSLDHLFLDQDAIPTLVEVKRSSDTRIRREVVGQMLDYAANAVVYWPVETIRSRFEKTCEGQSVDAATHLAAFVGDGMDSESFWQQAKTNLQAGRIRLVFVADEIPSELRRVVEFLNSQMDPAEVLAIEIKQYIGQASLKTLVPRLIGQTAAAQHKKAATVSQAQKIDERAYLEEMFRICGPAQCEVARRIVAWAREQNLGSNFNKRLTSVSFIPCVTTEDRDRYPFSVSSKGVITVLMRWLREVAPFDDEGKRIELYDKLNAIAGVSIPVERMKGFPEIPLQSLTDDAALVPMLNAMTWIVHELRSPSHKLKGNEK